ncbi:MAG: hypothetical protein P8Y99_08245 [Calditrichaceae bacterium]
MLFIHYLKSRLFLLIIFLFISFAQSQIADSPDDSVAGIPVNYTEANVNEYSLPDPLICLDGQIVDDAEIWMNKRRKEVLKLFEQYQFGQSPPAPENIRFKVFEHGISAFDGIAERTQVTIYFSNNADEPKMDLLMYVPSKTTKPLPVFSVHPTVYYGDIEPDFPDDTKYGVRSIFNNMNNSQPEPCTWGSISAWSWGLSRALDYFETDESVDANRVAIAGVSRLGKTVLWAGAIDPRFALVIPICSGESGAALSRRNYGETIAHIAAPTRYYYWFTPKYKEYGNDVNALPVDSHMLISLLAPRPVLLITGNTDKWSDPYGEFLAAEAAEPVYKLLGKEGLNTNQMPSAGEPILNDIGFYMHDGGHGLYPTDWNVILDFLQKHMQP